MRIEQTYTHTGIWYETTKELKSIHTIYFCHFYRYRTNTVKEPKKEKIKLPGSPAFRKMCILQLQVNVRLE